jgi:Flp pilus assembly secretin CpaC
MANLPIAFPNATKTLKSTANERSSRWVAFPKSAYLLPLVGRSDKYVPVVDEDGQITLKVEHADSELSALVDRFYSTVAMVADGEIAASFENYADFIKLVKRLLQTNYDLPDSEVLSLLTLTQTELSALFGNVLKHVRSK